MLPIEQRFSLPVKRSQLRLNRPDQRSVLLKRLPDPPSTLGLATQVQTNGGRAVDEPFLEEGFFFAFVFFFENFP